MLYVHRRLMKKLHPSTKASKMTTARQNNDFNLRIFIAQGDDKPFFMINREERHLAAILFHLLARSENVARLLEHIKCYWELDPESYEVYFEYSYMRDLWYNIKENSDKLSVIINPLAKIGVSDALLIKLKGYTTPHEFNQFFIGKTSSASGNNFNLNRHIQSPANWRLPEFEKYIKNDDDLVAVCKLKWAFRVKPDLVIHTDRDHAICIELKLESGESFYPSRGNEKTLLRKRGLYCAGGRCKFPVSQTALQKFMMETLLRLKCRFLLVTRSEHEPTLPRDDDKLTKLPWRCLRDTLDYRGLPKYMEWAWEHAADLAQAEVEAKPGLVL
jgi:hypothetical protein